MKKFISMMIVLTLCMAVIPSGITAFADNAIKYTEDLTAHIDAYKTANSVNDLSGTADMPGTYGTFNHKLQMYCAIQSNNGYRLVTYNTKPNIINYNFYNIENNKYVDLKAATISAFIRNESGSLTGTGTLELRYMYVSDENYFSVILDYEQNKAYGVAMRNGVKTSTEISGVKFSAVEMVTVEVDFNSSTAECRIYNASHSFDVTKTINVSNIDYLKENSTNLSQFVYTAHSGALNMLWLKNVSYTCSIKEKVKYNTTKSIGSNEYADKELKILAEGVSPRSAFKYGSIDMKVSDNNISCTQTGYSDGVNTAVTKSRSTLCFGTGVHSRPTMLYTMNLTNENKDYAKIKFGIKLKNADAFDDFTLNFGYVPYTEDPNKMADFDYYRRTLLYGHNIKDYLAKTTEWQNIELPLSIFTADASNKFAVPGTSNVFTWERVDWKNFNIIMFSVDKDAENQGFELRDVSIITPEKRECTAEFMLASSSGEPVKQLSDVKGKSIDCFIRANNDKEKDQEIMPVLLVYKNERLVDIITGKMTAQSNETTSGNIKLFDVPQNTEGFSLKLFLAGPENILDIRSEILTYN